MIKILPYSLMLLVFVPDGEPQYYPQADQGKPTQIVVSAYTQNGCLEELQQEAKNRGVEVKLTNVSVRVKFRHGTVCPNLQANYSNQQKSRSSVWPYLCTENF